MTAATLSPRPLSLFHPSTPGNSSVDNLAPLKRPRSPATSSYRPFSIHISDSSPAPRRRSIIRSPSLVGMGFGFKDRMREKEKEQEQEHGLSHRPKAFDTSPSRSGSPLRSATSPPFYSSKHATDRPSASNGISTPPKEKGLKKRRSLASILSATPENSSNSSASPSRSSSSSPVYIPLGRSPLSTSDSIQLSPVYENKAKYGHIAKTLEEKRQLRRKPPNNFVRKNTWLRRQNMKVHPYRLEATYMQAYDPIQLENDHYTDILLRRLNPLDSPSFHNYGRKIPLYALDLGCGSGHWLLEASNSWKTSQITGFDLMDTLAPGVLGQDNIQFVRGNFLKYPLPFADKSFDFVRMANLSLCIPYDKWEFVLSEVHRVLTIEGRLELIDDQIFFPYAAPAMPPASTSASQSTHVNRNGDASWFDEDEDTLEEGDDDSMHTDSTLISDADLSSSSHSKPRFRDSTRPLPKLPMPPTSDHSDSGDTIATTDIPGTPRPSPWSEEAEASKDMETVFQNMLNHKFGIHTRPSDFVADMMKHVFGNGRKSRTYHLKLAPSDSSTDLGLNTNSSSGGSTENGSDKDEKTSRTNAKVGMREVNGTAKPWFTVEWDNEERKRVKREKKFGKPDVHRRATDGLRPHTPDISIPEGISAKAAGRLGIGENASRRPSILEKIHLAPPEPLGLLKTRERKASNVRNTPSPISDGEVIDGESTELLPSPDASSSGLGSSSSTIHANTATPTPTCRPQSFSSLSSTSSMTSQSPGLIIWPATFLPLSPSELEMHACKHVHTLLGCKPALAEFIEMCVDENGARIVSDEEFHRAIWAYECFRRRRFHWPSEIPDWDRDPLDESWDAVFRSAYNSTSKSGTSRTSTSSNTEGLTTSLVDISSSLTRPYTVDELSHVRTLRIFEAVKNTEFTIASLQFPRPPPLPPIKA